MIHLYFKTPKSLLLKSYAYYLQKYLEKQNIVYKIIYFPIKIHKISLIKSPHVYKKSKDQFEARYASCCLIISSKHFVSVFKQLLKSKPAELNMKIIAKQ